MRSSPGHAETILAAAGGALLGGAAGWRLGPGGAAAAVLSGGLNGALAGARGIYDWRRLRGWAAFAADSTWGLAGTTAGNLLNLVNLASGKAGYRPDLSRRQNRHVHDHGARVRRGFAITVGNVMSNTGLDRTGPADERRRIILRHEDLHIWQNRLFGPLYTMAYGLWTVAGALVGLAVWLLGGRREHRLGRLVETAAYYDNPFEYWAYRRDGRWAVVRADPLLKWRSRTAVAG